MENENSQLSLADLASLHSMIEAACNRGAFRASEMSQVGQVFDKLSNFLNASAQQNNAEQNPQGEANA
jgi:hypothetical protein